MLNNVVLIGRLTADPNLRYTPSGVAVTTFTLACDRPVAKGKDKEADFIPVVTFKQTAEAAANYLKKGKLAAVEGRIQTRNYEKDGRKVYITEVIANNVRFLEKSGNEPHKETEYSGNEISNDDLPF